MNGIPLNEQQVLRLGIYVRTPTPMYIIRVDGLNQDSARENN